MSSRQPNESKPESAREQRETVLENQRKAHDKASPENFKEEAIEDKVIDLGPVSSHESNIKDLDPKK
jgi:hypothetical protein